MSNDISPYHIGSPTGEKCPECGSEIIYNGNYFCAMWGVDTKSVGRVGGPCNWALPHPQELYRDKMICYKLAGNWERKSKLSEYELVYDPPAE